MKDIIFVAIMMVTGFVIGTYCFDEERYYDELCARSDRAELISSADDFCKARGK